MKLPNYNNNKMTDILWKNNLYHFLAELLPKFIADETFCAKQLDDESMKIWIKAFTHESIDATDNYEVLETLGDTILGTAFVYIIMEKFPTKSNSNFITEMKNYYMSKMPHGHYSKKLKLYMHTRVQKIDKFEIFNVYADVFESFVGALSTNSERIFNGSSLLVAKKFLNWLFITEVLEPKKGEGSAITIVQQIFSRFELPPLNEQKCEENKHKIFKLYLCTEHLTFLKKHSIVITNSLLSFKTANTLKSAKALVYEEALSVLEKYKITTKWAKELKEKLDMEIPEVQKYYKKATKKALDNNILKLRFFVPKKSVTEGYILVQLEGVKEDKIVKLHSIFKEKSSNCYVEAKAELMKMYVS